MLKERTFNVVVVVKGHGTGVELASNNDKTVFYDGTKLTVDLAH